VLCRGNISVSVILQNGGESKSIYLSILMQYILQEAVTSAFPFMTLKQVVFVFKEASGKTD
jgi:hypothetical protein